MTLLFPRYHFSTISLFSHHGKGDFGEKWRWKKQHCGKMLEAMSWKKQWCEKNDVVEKATLWKRRRHRKGCVVEKVTSWKRRRCGKGDGHVKGNVVEKETREKSYTVAKSILGNSNVGEPQKSEPHFYSFKRC